MQIRFQCEACGESVGVDPHQAGKQVKCPKCGEAVETAGAEWPALAEPAGDEFTLSPSVFPLPDRESDLEVEPPPADPPPPTAVWPPTVADSPPPEWVRPVPADYGKRAVAERIDQCITVPGTLAVVFGTAVVCALIYGRNPSFAKAVDGGWGQVLVALHFVLLCTVAWPYYAYFESSRWQGTPGMRRMGLKVVDQGGNRISFGLATARYFVMFLRITRHRLFSFKKARALRYAFKDDTTGTLVVER